MHAVCVHSSIILLGRIIMQQILGYVRVSTREQNLGRQLAAMRKMGIEPQNIYMDKISGKDFVRPQKPLPQGFARVYQAWRRGELSMNQAARKINMPVSTFYNKCQQQKEREKRRK